VTHAPYNSPARILEFGGVPGAVHVSAAEAHVFCAFGDDALAVMAAADAVGLDAKRLHASAQEQTDHRCSIKLVVTIRPELPMQVRTTMRRMCDVPEGA
jgi:hypothetical protein